MDINVSSAVRPRREFRSRDQVLLGNLLVLLASWVVMLPWAEAAVPPLTLEAAQQIAVLRSLQIKAGDLAVDAAVAVVPAAGELPDPVLTLGIENLPVEGPDRFRVDRDSMTMQRVGVMQELTRPGKRRLRSTRAEINTQVATAQRRLSVAMVRQETALAWFERHYAELSRENLRQQVDATRSELTATESAYRQGQGNATNVLAERGLLAQLEDRVSAADYRVQAAQIELSRWLGEAGDRPLGGAPAIDFLPDHVRDVVTALTEHPELQVLEREVQLARTEVDLARAARHSDWSVQLMYGARDSAFADMVTVSVSVPLQINRGDRQDRELASRLATAAQVEAERDDMRRDHEARIRALLEEWQSTLKRRDRYRTAIIPLAMDRTSAALAAYRGGQVPLAEVLSARREEVAVQLQAVEIELQAARAWAELSFINPPDERQDGAVSIAAEPTAGELTP